MKLHFEDNLDYQHAAIESVAALFKGQEINRTEFTVTYRSGDAAQGSLGVTESELGIGNKLELLDDEILENMQDIQLKEGSVVLVPELPRDPSDNRSQYILQPPERSIYVLGAVNAPGRYAFEPSLSLLDVLSAAGGPQGSGDLRNLRIVRGREAASEARRVDLSLFIETGDWSLLPDLAAGDSIFVPSVDRPFVDKAPEDTVRVLGAVGAPGRYIFNDEMTILDLLAEAGGPTGDAYNEAIVVVNLSCCRDQARSFDLAAFARTGDVAMLPVVRPGDTVYVPDISQSPFRQFIDGVTDISRVVTLAVLLLAL
mgnify:CR=1 FL=1